MTRVSAIHGEAAFATLAQEWDVLAQRSMTNTPFQQLAYQKSWWENLRPQAGKLHTITVRDDDGQLQAIASLYNNNGALYFNATIINRHESNAAPRCADQTTTNNTASAGKISPTR